MTGARAMLDILMRGRWSNVKVMKIYLQEASAALEALSAPPAVRKRASTLEQDPAARIKALGLIPPGALQRLSVQDDWALGDKTRVFSE